MKLILFPGAKAAATSAAVVAITLAVVSSAPVAADDSWNPFRERDQGRAERAAKSPPAERPAPLAPMRGADQTGAGGETGAGAPSSPVAADAAATDRRPPAGSDVTQRLAPLDERSRGVDRSELPALDPNPTVTATATATATEGPAVGGVPRDIWQGLDARTVEGHLGKIEVPLRSAAQAAIWQRLMTAAGAPAGAETGDFEAFRLDRLLRSGLLGAASVIIEGQGVHSTSGGAASRAAGPLNRLFRAKVAVALGLTSNGCDLQAELGKERAVLPAPVRTEILLLAGYCAAIAGNRPAAGLSAELAREGGASDVLSLAALDAVAADVRFTGPIPKAVTLADYRFLQLGAGVEPRAIIMKADAALLVALARDAALEGGLRQLAAERAARLVALEPTELAEIYRMAVAKGESSGSEVPVSLPTVDPQTVSPQPASSQSLPTPVDARAAAMRRGDLFRAADIEKTPLKRARLIRSLLDDARRAGLYPQTVRAVAGVVRQMQIAPEFGWFAETAIEVMILDGRFDEARRIVDLADRFDRPAGGDGVKHWLALIDIADPKTTGRRGDMLPSMQHLALKGRLSGPALHRLATVLDALDIDVPIPLWDAANKAPLPPKGFLPETGVLSELADASKKKELGRTLLLSLRALGRDGPEATELIALGDVIRALRRAGAEADARHVAVEVLFAGWPRGM